MQMKSRQDTINPLMHDTSKSNPRSLHQRTAFASKFHQSKVYEDDGSNEYQSQ